MGSVGLHGRDQPVRRPGDIPTIPALFRGRIFPEIYRPLTTFRNDPEPLVAFAHAALASFYTAREDNLVAENRLNLAETRDGLAWSERLSLNLTLRPGRTWLGDIVGASAVRIRAGRFGSLRERTGSGFRVLGFPENREGASLRECGASRRWSSVPTPTRTGWTSSLTQSYETKYVASQKASLWARLGTYQYLNLLDGEDYWTLGFELTLGARVIF
ncbi:MAG: hypothetical protein MZU95_08940 [Desulfomicrobium escambiense]|nr:hypothetical protein [Desulfomicrobium escambiense]